MVIVVSALGAAISRYKLHQINKEPTGYFQGGRQGSDCALLFFSSLASLTSSMMDFALTFLAPPSLVALVATQVDQ